MPETAAAQPADSESTDFTTMDGPGVDVELDPAAADRLPVAHADRLATGVRLIFKATLAVLGADGAAARVALDTEADGRIGFLPRDVAARYRGVLNALERAGRKGRCAGYLQRGVGGLEARVLLDEPYECLRRIEADVLDAITPAVPRSA